MPRADARRSARFSFRGQLRRITEMPLDILFEVACNLPLDDVLTLTRTSHALRNILMSRSAITVWRESCKNEPDLPVIPNDLNEPQFANLLYSDHCHYCTGTPAVHTFWTLHVRCCAACLIKNFKPLGTLLQLQEDILSRNTSELLCVGITPEGRFALPSDVAVVKSKLLAIQGNTVELDAYLKERREFVRERFKFAAKCQDYLSKRKKRLRRERRDAVYDRLVQIGFGYEVQQIKETGLTVIDEQPAVNTEEALTETAWGKMKAVLVDIMEEVREKLLKKQKKTLLKKRVAVVSEIIKGYRSTVAIKDVMIPPLADICMMPDILRILFNENREAYTNRDHFEDAFANLPEWCRQWKAEKCTLLANLAQAPPVASSSSNTPSAAVQTVLELATTYFKCNECLSPFPYPDILSHACLTQLSHGYRNRPDDEVILLKLLDAEPWNVSGRRVTFSRNAHLVSTSIVRVIGLDPTTAKASTLDGIELACTLCKRRKVQKQLPWRQAVLHEIKHTLDDNKAPTWSMTAASAAHIRTQTNTVRNDNDPVPEVIDLTLDESGDKDHPIVV